MAGQNETGTPQFLFGDNQTKDGKLTYLTGKALDEQRALPFEVTGDIDTVRRFLEHRFTNAKGPHAPIMEGEPPSLQYVDASIAVIVVNKEKGIIKLSLDPNHPQGTKITGKLEKTEELKQFHINEAYYFTREALVKLLRFNKRFFTNNEMFDNVLASVQKLDITAQTNTKAESDNRANKVQAFTKTVQSTIPESFVLHIPIFKGQAKETFRVELCFDHADKGVQFWLESPELAERIDILCETIIDSQMEAFEADFVIINE